MKPTIALSCSCGALRGEAHDLSPRTGTRLICHCDDCQAYAEYLGRSDVILDRHGGTDIFQLAPAHISLTAGIDQLRCMRHSPKGVLRWYAGCCNTPVANTAATPRMPFLGVPTIFFCCADEEARLRQLGPIRAKLHGRYARGEMPRDAHVKYPLSLVARSLTLIAFAALRRGHEPTPFFDPHTGQPVVAPTVISLEERQRLLRIVSEARSGGR